MKTISHRRSRGERRLILVLGIGGVLVLLLLSPFRGVGGILEYIAAPLHSLKVLVPDSLETYFVSKHTLRMERDQAIEQSASVSRELELLHATETDLEKLRALTSRAENTDILSGVLMTPPHSPYDSLVLDKGVRDGVVVGALVRAHTGRPLGTIVRTEPTMSVVALFSSPGVETIVYVMGANVYARAVGRGGGTIAVLIPHGAPVTVGDAVLLPGLSAELVGSIAWISDDLTAPGTIVHVPLEDTLSSLRYVAISRESAQTPTVESIAQDLTHASTTLSHLFTPLRDLASSTPLSLLASSTEGTSAATGTLVQ